MDLLYRIVNVINMLSVCGYLFLSKAFRNSNFMATWCINFEKKKLGGGFSDQLKKSFVIKELDTTYMLCDRVHAYATECMLGG